MSLKERSEERRKRMIVNRATDFQSAEDWDLDFWQRRTPQERLSVLVAIRNDVAAVSASRRREKMSRSAALVRGSFIPAFHPSSPWTIPF